MIRTGRRYADDANDRRTETLFLPLWFAAGDGRRFAARVRRVATGDAPRG